jgi:hypothetical protein
LSASAWALPHGTATSSIMTRLANRIIVFICFSLGLGLDCYHFYDRRLNRQRALPPGEETFLIGTPSFAVAILGIHASELCDSDHGACVQHHTLDRLDLSHFAHWRKPEMSTVLDEC